MATKIDDLLKQLEGCDPASPRFGHLRAQIDIESANQLVAAANQTDRSTRALVTWTKVVGIGTWVLAIATVVLAAATIELALHPH